MVKEDAEFERTVQFLFSQLPMFQRDGASAYKKDLTNTIRLCDFLGNPQHKFKSVHVAGTNGKGSSSHYLAAVLQHAGYKTGLYTSPHLKSFTERIKINGIEIEKQAVVEFVDRIKPIIEEIKPSFFEITVAMCFDYFAREQVDIAIIEVGMGGRLDSTNVLIPEVCLITNISYDHQQWLGDTLPKIAAEKAGIIKQNTPVIISERQEEIVAVFENTAHSHQATLAFAEDDYSITIKNGFHFRWGSKHINLSNSAGAAYQAKNLTGVLKVLDIMTAHGYSIKPKDVEYGLEHAFRLTGFKGRWQQLGEQPTMYCDVGHNEAGLHYITNQLASCEYDQLHFVLGMVADKDILKLLELLPKQAVYYYCAPNIPRALNVKKLASMAKKVGLKGSAYNNVSAATSAAKEAAELTDFIFIGGSNFVVAEIDNL